MRLPVSLWTQHTPLTSTVLAGSRRRHFQGEALCSRLRLTNHRSGLRQCPALPLVGVADAGALERRGNHEAKHPNSCVLGVASVC